MRNGRLPLALVALALLGLTACGDEGADVTGTGPTSPAATPTTPTATSPTAEPAATTPLPTTSAAPTFPPAAEAVQQGDVVWAVYLAVARVGDDGRPDDPAGDLDRARRQAAAAGYEGAIGGGQVECDRGAREALRLDPGRDYYTVSIFFATRADAEQFVAAYEPGVVGTAEITAYCLD